MEILFFNVGLGQCVFFYPRKNPEYGLMIDAGHTSEVNPVDFLINKNFFPKKQDTRELGNLTLTNYDHDHYSNLAYLRSKVKIKTIKFPKNLEPHEIDNLKPDKTVALGALLEIRREYTASADDYNPPFKKNCYYLEKSDFDGDKISTNDLSQIVFVTFNGTTVCIPGDLEEKSWKLILRRAIVQELLKITDVFVASHHGRISGFHEDVFSFCKPECIIMSDKEIIHGTQENTSSLYGRYVKGNGISFPGNQNPRKVLTTRSDGNIWIRIEENGERKYNNFTV